MTNMNMDCNKFMFHGITISSLSKQLNAEISTLVKDLIHATSQLNSNGLIQSIQTIFNDKLEMNHISNANANTKLNLSHLFALMHIYQCNIQLIHFSKLIQQQTRQKYDDDRKSNKDQYQFDYNILELFDTENCNNKHKICHSLLIQIQTFKKNGSMILYFGDNKNIINNKSNKQHTIITSNKSDIMLMDSFTKFNPKQDSTKHTLNTILFDIATLNHKIWTEGKKRGYNVNLNASKTMPVISRNNISVSLLSSRSRSQNDMKKSIQKKEPHTIYVKIPRESLGPYHDKGYHRYGKQHNLPIYSMEEIAKHNTSESCWIIVNDLVLDVTPFLPYHPAASKSILRNGGKNCDGHFKMHSKKAQKLFWKFTIGRVEKEGSECVIQ